MPSDPADIAGWTREGLDNRKVPALQALFNTNANAAGDNANGSASSSSSSSPLPRDRLFVFPPSAPLEWLVCVHVCLNARL